MTLIAMPQRHDMGALSDTPVRLDKWLWAARFFKTRSLAQDAIEQGRVRVNEERVKTARLLRVGERVSLRARKLTRSPTRSSRAVLTRSSLTRTRPCSMAS